jgi:amidase
VTNPIGDTPIHPDCVITAEHTASCSSLWATSWSWTRRLRREELLTQFGAVWAAECGFILDDWGKKVGREVKADDVEILTWALAELGREVTAAQLVGAVHEAMKANRRAAQWWAGSATGPGFDLLLTPTLGEPPVAHGTFNSTPEEPLGGFFRSAAFVPYTAQFNVVASRESASRCTGTTGDCPSPTRRSGVLR